MVAWFYRFAIIASSKRNIQTTSENYIMTNATQAFNVTKTTTITISNNEIVQARHMSRAKIMVLLSLNESQARKVKDAIKAGELVEVLENIEPAYQLTKSNKADKIVRIAPMTAWLAEILPAIVTAQMTAGEIYDVLNAKFGDEKLPSLIPSSNKKPVRSYISRKIIDGLKFINAVQEGKGVKGLWTLA